MKLYYIANARMPSEKAHAIQIAKMCEALIGAGADLELVVPRRRNKIKESAKSFYGLSGDIPLRRLPIFPVTSLGKFGYYVAGLSFTLSYILFLLWRKICGEQFFVHTIDMDQFSFIGVSFLGALFSFEVHDTKKYGVLFDRIFRKAKVVMTINNIIKKELVANFHLLPEKILVCPNGIDVPFFARHGDKNLWRKRWEIPNDARVILYTGKCYKWKGMEIFYDALPKLPSDTLLCFVGCTREEVEKVTGKNFDDPRARFFGGRPYNEMPLWMAVGDVLVVLGTKKNDYSYFHTSPMKLFEYMATGRPILSARTPAVSDVVSDSEVTFCAPDASSDFVLKIKEILENKEISAEKSSRAFKLVKKFSWDNRARALLSVFTKREF